MKILNTDKIREEIIENIIKSKRNGKLIILTSNAGLEVIHYKKAIIKRCREFDIEVIEKDFSKDSKNEDIINFLDQYDKNDGYIFLMPFKFKDNIDYLKENINLKDLDGFTYKSLGKVIDGKVDFLPATAMAVVKFLDSIIDYKGKNIVIANRTKVIGLPLANFLVSKSATVAILNSSSQSSKEIINNCDIFISAIGKANFYGREYFKDGQILIDVGTSYKDGKIVGDIDYEKLSDLDVNILTSKSGIGQITTYCLINKLM